MNSLYLQSHVDPRDLAVNIRYRSSQALPVRVRDAIINVQDDVFEAIRGGSWGEFTPPTMAMVQLTFVFPDRKNDIDGPIKHTLDALQSGIRKAGFPEWNDRMIEQLKVERWVGEPHIQIYIGEVDDCTP